MKSENIYNLKMSEEFIRLFAQVNYLREKGATVKIEEVSETRTNTQNRAIHLFFKLLANALNEHGEYYHYFNFKGELVEIPWDGEMVKTYIWKPLQKEITDKKSTAHLTTKEIDPIYSVIHKHYSQEGIELFFPSRFSMFLDQMK
jgi:hypothetical protein